MPLLASLSIWKRSPRGSDVLSALANQASNQNLLINRLPGELLSTFLQTALEDTPISAHYDSVFRLSRVCVRWKSLIETTSHFWDVVDNRFDIPTLSLVLTRSGNRPIRIRWSRVTSTRATVADDARLFFLVAGECHRWSTLEFECTPSGEVLFQLSKCVTPCLHSVHWACDTLDGDDTASWKDYPFFVGTSSPQLRSLRVTTIPIMWRTATFPQLETLDIRHAGEFAPTPLEFNLILSRCRGLRSITLQSIEDMFHYPMTSDLSPVARLPLLEELQLVDVPQSWLFLFLRSLDAPPLRRFIVESSIEPCSDPPCPYKEFKKSLWWTTLAFLPLPLEDMCTRLRDGGIVERLEEAVPSGTSPNFSVSFKWKEKDHGFTMTEFKTYTEERQFGSDRSWSNFEA